MIRSLLISNAAFIVKAAFAFMLTAYVANALVSEEFAIWSVLLSLGLYFSLSDFGVGQYLLRRFVELKDGHASSIKDLIGQSLGLFLPVSIFLVMVFYLICAQIDRLAQLDGLVLFGFLVLIISRGVMIPFAALLSAFELFHVRKVCESYSYVLAAVLVFLAISVFDSYQLALLLYAMALLLGSVGYFFASRKYLGVSYIRGVNWRDLVSCGWLIGQSRAYFVNNLSLLVTRGGLVFLLGFVLNDNQVAEVSIYYAIFYQLVFQVFDMALRTYQPRFLRDGCPVYRFLGLMGALVVVFVVAALILGGWFLSVFFPQVEVTAEGMRWFIYLSAIELFISIVCSKWSMLKEFSRWMAFFSLLRAALYLLVVLFLGDAGLIGILVALFEVSLCCLFLMASLEARSLFRGAII